MVKALSALSCGRSLVCRQSCGNLAANQSSIDHNVLCLARMHVDALYGKFSACGIKVFIGHLALVITVHGVGKICLEIVQIKQIRTLSDLFIRGKSNPDIAVRSALCDNLL